jgi:hypothetical protein
MKAHKSNQIEITMKKQFAHVDGGPRFENTPLCPPKYSIVWGERGPLKFVWGLESSYFCELGAHAKFRNPKPSAQI